MRNSILIKVIVVVMLKLVKIFNSSNSYSLNQELDNAPLTDPLNAFEDFKENTFQRKLTIIVDPKKEDCYFISGVKAGISLSVEFMVTYLC